MAGGSFIEAEARRQEREALRERLRRQFEEALGTQTKVLGSGAVDGLEAGSGIGIGIGGG